MGFHKNKYVHFFNIYQPFHYMGNCALYMYALQISQNNCFGYNHKSYDSKHQNHEFGCQVQCNGFGLPVMDTWVIHTRQTQEVLSRMHKKKTRRTQKTCCTNRICTNFYPLLHGKSVLHLHVHVVLLGATKTSYEVLINK